MKKFSLIAFFGLSLTLAAQAGDLGPRKSWSFKDAALIPIQSNGRVKPLDSFAREIMLYLTGSRFFEGWTPTELLLSWMTQPEQWDEKAFIQVSREDVKRQLGLNVTQSRFTPKELFHDSYLAQYAQEMQSKPEAPGMKSDPREAELKALLNRIGTYRRMITGEGWTLIPVKDAWEALSTTTHDPSNEIRKPFAQMALGYRNGDQAEFEKGAAATRQAVVSKMEPDESLQKSLAVEYFYNHTHPFLFAWILYLSAVLMGFAAITVAKPWARKLWLALTYGGLAVHVSGIAMRCYVAGRPPVSNMYESVIWVSLGVLIFATIIYWRQRQQVLLMVAAALAMFGLIAADAAPAVMDPGIHPLVPVLRSNYWLTIHVLTITLGYAAFALTAGLGNVTLFQILRGGTGLSARVEKLNQLTYRAMQFGVVLLAAGTILGGVWADYSWGRFWGWDPKEVWALIALLTYIAVLHARFTGWVGQFGYAIWTVCCFMSVVMAWYGVNFVLGVGLHSYGFSTGGRGWVALFVAAQLGFVGVTAAVARMRKSQRRAMA